MEAVVKILCLHGKMQTGEIFSGRLGTLRRKLKNTAQLFFVDAPFIVPPSSPDDANEYRTWFYRIQEGSTCISPSSVEKALSMLEEEWVKNGPFAGVIAFSMGGCVATVMAALPGRFPGCKFVVTAGSPDIDLDSLLKSNVCQKFPSDGHIPMGLASFHFAGLQDSAVPAQASRNLSLKYNPLKCIFVEHEQGHCFPSKAILNDQCVNFIKRYAHSDAVVSAAPIATVVVPSVEPVTDFEKNPSPEDMVAQFEELEVLSVIYPEDISLLPELGSDSVDIADYIAAGKRTGREVISIQLSPLEGTDSLMPSKWKGQFKILVKRPYNYPSAAAPVVELGLGTLSLHDVSTSLQRSLLQSIDDVARENVGEASIMSCVQAANDWLCTHNSSSIFASAEAKHDAVTVTVAAEAVEPELRLLGEDDTSEDATSEMIRNVSLLAGQLIAKIRRNGIRADTSCYSLSGPSSDAKGSAIELSASARGAWNYTVGLVGKPSAGKSTFYNVATRAVLSRDGRLMAAVASHPFTTIEPNVGPGWWLSPVDESISDTSITCDAAHRGARYGRDKNGGRYLPLIVKDVAGLVPGKGNRFLGDLCDADVLVHVVDASGKSDRDGNTVDDTSAGSTPMEDAYWIREELHRWIFGNIRAKWSSVVRRGSDSAMQRIVQLFSGYQGPRACILSAIQYSELNVAHVASWTAHDLHKLVALYLSIRFPTCIALNKIDRIDSHQRDLISKWQREVSDLGEVAVPVCAAAENWNLLRKAGKTSGAVGSDGTESSFGQASYDHVQEIFGPGAVEGVLLAISAAVMLRPPVLCFPVSDLATEMPVGWHAGVSLASDQRADSSLIDCILLKPGSTVEDVYDALKRGELSHAHISGDFVRAEGRSINPNSRKKQLGREVIIDESNCVIKVQTNRKSVWQGDARAAADGSGGALSS